MDDQRVEARAALGLEDAGDRLAVGRVAGKAVDGFRRQRDDLAGRQQRQRAVKSVLQGRMSAKPSSPE